MYELKDKIKLAKQCVKLYKRGWNRTEIGNKLGISYLTVYRYQRAMGLKFDTSKSPNKFINK